MAGIYGLSGSGMDIDTIVKNLMKAQSARYDTLSQKKTQLEWKKSAFNTIYTSINEFRNNAVWNNTLQNNLLAKSVTSSNESVAKVTANSDAANVNHVMTVSQLATGVTKTSSANITTGQSKTTVAEQFGLSSGLFNIKINGKTITVNTSESINSLVSNINKADAGVKATYDANLDRFFLYSTNTGSSAAIDFTGSSATGLSFLSNNLKLETLSAIGTEGVASYYDTSYGNDTSLTLDKMGYSGSLNLQIKNGDTVVNIAVDTTTDTMDSLLDKINNAGINGEASYEPANGTFSLKASNGSLDLSGSDSAAMSFLTNQLKLPAVTSGTDAKFTLDGAELTQSSNSFSIASVKYDLMGTGTVNLNVSSDPSKIVSNVKSFIEAYNAELSKLNAALNEEKYKDFLPLTSDQRESLSESEIATWETKAKSGMLYRNSILREAVTTMRNDFMSPIEGLKGKYTSASSIGITSGDYSEGGKLYLDETKLLQALEEDPEIVYKIFGSNETDSTHAQKGIAARLYETLMGAEYEGNKIIKMGVLGKIAAEAGATVSSETKSNLYKQITTYKERMEEWETRLQAMEESYYTKFNAMEVALYNLTQQSSWLDSLFTSNS